MGRLTRDGTAEPVSRDQTLRCERGQGNMHFPCSADHEQDWQPYLIDPYSCYMCDHTYIHKYIACGLILVGWSSSRRGGSRGTQKTFFHFFEGFPQAFLFLFESLAIIFACRPALTLEFLSFPLSATMTIKASIYTVKSAPSLSCHANAY